MAKRESFSVPKQMQTTYDAVARLTDEFCAKHLNDEYATLARKLTAALCRKRPSPLLSGKPESWASGVMYALGRINFLFDPSQTPHMRADELSARFGVSKSGAAAKGKRIMDDMDMILLDPRWCLPSKMEENPMAWLIQVNGFIVDARTAPREIQEEAFRLGLIPYMPKNEEVEDASLR